MEELIKETRVVCNIGLHECNLRAYVLTTTPYALILEIMMSEWWARYLTLHTSKTSSSTKLP